MSALLFKSMRLTAAILIAIGVVVTIEIGLRSNTSIANAQQDRSGQLGRSILQATQAFTIVYNQPPSGSYYRQSSQVGYDPYATDYDQYVWDDFTLKATSVITQINWRGEYQYNAVGPYGPFPITDFVVSLYTSTAGGWQPDVINPAMLEYIVGGTANEDPPWTNGYPIQSFHDYKFTLPTPFTVEAGIKYWLQIEGVQPGPADWGLVGGSNGTGVIFIAQPGIGDFQFFRIGADTAFTLSGYIIGIGADFKAAPVIGEGPLTVTFMNTSVGSFTSSLWDFGDGFTSTVVSPVHRYTGVGSYTVTLMIANNTMSNSLTYLNFITVTLPISSVSIAPNPITVTVGTLQSFAATVLDINNKPLSIDPVWATDAGTMVNNVLHAQTTPATDRHVTATVGNLIDVASVNVKAGSLATIQVLPNPINVTIGATQTFTTTGYDLYANILPISPVWSTNGGSMSGSMLLAQTKPAPTRRVTATVSAIKGFALVNVMGNVYLPIVLKLR